MIADHRNELTEKIEQIDQLLATEAQWTRDVAARDSAGYHVLPRSKEACCWCLMGAAMKVADTDSQYRRIMVCFQQASQEYHITVGEYNDMISFAAMKAMLVKAKEISRSYYG